MLIWAEKQATAIEDFEELVEPDEDTANRISGEVFNILVNTLKASRCS